MKRHGFITLDTEALFSEVYTNYFYDIQRYENNSPPRVMVTYCKGVGTLCLGDRYSFYLTMEGSTADIDVVFLVIN